MYGNCDLCILAAVVRRRRSNFGFVEQAELISRCLFRTGTKALVTGKAQLFLETLNLQLLDADY